MMSQTLAVYLLSGVIFIGLIEQCLAVKCYVCHVSQTYYIDKDRQTPLCKNFDESEEFTIDCPYSTMCVKKIATLELQNGQNIETVTRSCASQKFTDQVFREGAWRREHKVEEPYEEGCQDFKEDNLSASSARYCYCRGNLCNSARSTKEATSSLHTDTMAVIFVFNIMKYLRSGTTTTIY